MREIAKTYNNHEIEVETCRSKAIRKGHRQKWRKERPWTGKEVKPFSHLKRGFKKESEKKSQRGIHGQKEKDIGRR